MFELSKPLHNGRINVKNRLVMPPMATAKANPDGTVSRALLDYYNEKSRGGHIGLIIVEHSFVSIRGKSSECQLSCSSDGDVAGLRELADVIRHNGSKAVLQINHAGSAGRREVTGMDPIGPSDAPNPRNDAVPSVMDEGAIRQTVREFADAARRAKEAGFDGVEIHSAHGYLLNQFYSPLTNKRTDLYGGDSLRRIRIHREVLGAAREAVGRDFPIFMRLGASDYVEGGSTLEDAFIAAQELEKAGLDLLDISGGFCGYTIDGLNGQGFFAPVTQALKQAVSIPVLLTGGVTEADAADRLLAEGKADLIGVGRAIYEDSDWAVRAMTRG